MSDNYLDDFPDWVGIHKEALAVLAQLIREWNEKINVISRKDIDRLEQQHIASSLAISHIIRFKPKTQIMDVGTGGGFPGLPMAIIYPDVEFLLVDSVGKKLKVIDAIVRELGLSNVKTRHCRVETIPERFDFITGRAVTALPTFLSWVKKRIARKGRNDIANGIFYWKGGDLEDDLKASGAKSTKVHALNNLLNNEDFDEKYIAYLKMK